MDTLKACGHRVTLILKVGPHQYQNGCSKYDDKKEDGEEVDEDGRDEVNFMSHDSSHDSSCDSQPHQLSDLGASNELEESKSPQTPESVSYTHLTLPTIYSV